MDNNNKNLMSFGLILGLALVISAGIASFTFYHLRTADYISTTGSAKVAATSDKVKWTSTITRVVKLSTVKDGYAKIDADLNLVKAFLATNGIPENQINVSTVFMNEIYDNNGSADKSYNLVQNIEVQSDDVRKIDNLAKNTNSLIVNNGVLFSTISLEFYYSKLPEARVALLADAVADAKARAQKLAEAGGKRIGTLKSASSGVVQVLSANSADVSDYGTYDTSKIDKEIMITVKASFAIK